MHRFKVHIAIFFLAGFLFPQGASGMHYFLVEHKPFKNSTFSFNKINGFEYHSCTYHLNGFSPLVLGIENLNEPARHFTREATIKFCCLENYVHQPDFNFQLRGPPFIPDFEDKELEEYTLKL